MRRLAEALRMLFAELQISLTRYAAESTWDKSTVSRFLRGERVPPWAFVRDLLVKVVGDRADGGVPTREVLEHLRSLHRAAPEEGERLRAGLETLERDLAEARRRGVQAELRCATRERQVESAEQHARAQAERERAEAQRELRERFERQAEAERARAAELERELRRLRGEDDPADEPLPRRPTAQHVDELASLPLQEAAAILSALPPGRAVTAVGQLPL